MFIIHSEYDISKILNDYKMSFIETKPLSYTLMPNTTITECETIENILESRFVRDGASYDHIMKVRMDYNEFMKAIDKILLATIGMTHNDLEDYDWLEEYDSEAEASEAVSEFLETLTY
ncbi:MAG: hypothetical protein JRJ27_20095 [Deltaproteobacteria bacterium]|nr:hypothetical protein [Deltaproteobacteria bacterium]